MLDRRNIVCNVFLGKQILRRSKIMAYSDKVLDHYSNPRNVGSLDKNSTEVGTGLVGAPECGDVMKLQIKVNPQTNVIEDAKFKTFGCGSAACHGVWEGQDRGRSPANQEHRNREGTFAPASEDSLLGARGRRDPRRHPRLEEEAGRGEADRCRSAIVQVVENGRLAPLRRADARRGIDVGRA